MFNAIDPAQAPLALRFEPIQNLIVDSERLLRLERAIVFADHCFVRGRLKGG